MFARLSQAELVEIQAEYRIEPWGDRRADLHAADVVCSVANIPRMIFGNKAKEYTPAECIRKFGEEKTGQVAAAPRRKSWAEMRAYLEGYTRAVGGQVVKHGERNRETGGPAPA